MTAAVERVVVALDAVSEHGAAIGAAVRLARRWQARLHGVFVEDDDLIRLAGLPFARQVTLGSGVEPLTRQHAERQLRAFAERARREVAASAARHGIEWSFEIVRGDSAAGVGATGDFAVFAATSRPIGGHFRIRSRSWPTAAPGADSYLLAHREGDRQGRVAVLLNGSDAGAERLLAAAIRLAEADDARLTVICDPAVARSAGFKQWLDRHLTGHAVETELEPMPAEPAHLHRRVVELRCRVVAVGTTAGQADPDRLRELAATLSCDVLVVR
ncbi:MAG: hypothetical protein JO032_13265 [Alphaproteobacteria bacterium]|nr:hypothetical protein [Alphaproteobacteria bacterium]